MTAPLDRGGVIAVIVVLPTTVTELAAVPPKLTAAPVAKPVPVMVTAVPPLTRPDGGETVSMIGAVFGVGPKNSDILGAVAAAPG